MKKMKRLNALGRAWQLVTYVGMISDKFHVSVTYTERYVEVSIFGGEKNYVDLDELNCWIVSNVDRYDHVRLGCTSDGDVQWLEVKWEIEQD